jgi:hypothetical protein
MKSLPVRLLETLGESTPRFVDPPQRLAQRDLRPASQVALCRRRYRHAKSDHPESPLRGVPQPMLRQHHPNPLTP